MDPLYQMRREKSPTFRILYGSIVGLGMVVVGLSLYRIISDRAPAIWLALALLAAVAGSFSLRIPGMHGRVSAGDTVTCLSILLAGPYAGALTAVADAVSGSLRCSRRRLQYAFYNSANSALSAFASGLMVSRLSGKPILYRGDAVTAASLLVPLCMMAGSYFLMNTGLVAAAVAAEKSLSFVDTWREGFMWTCVNYVAGAFVAGLLALTPDVLSPVKLAIVLLSCLAAYVSSRAHILLAARVRQHRCKAQADDDDEVQASTPL